jgi:hypothetical protein
MLERIKVQRHIDQQFGIRQGNTKETKKLQEYQYQNQSQINYQKHKYWIQHGKTKHAVS